MNLLAPPSLEQMHDAWVAARARLLKRPHIVPCARCDGVLLLNYGARNGDGEQVCSGCTREDRAARRNDNFEDAAAERLSDSRRESQV